ncbi:hypothetical protein K470DRAFT_266564 [Piedraia hortae CBS 480.64]|uniref:RRM domain-containing protein n=1 Tax=Piedraia hortae CBS 480.64 TaxID=1314780 RepID=A0A6A7BRB9_9PEZI|nr:hypothetical protein K470DRAFT_266564 [Piedraia hortae CBS 480.64]
MNDKRLSESPEEPLQRGEAALLSPASPKPLHLPSPVNITVLDMQTDVAFNQTEKHMANPSMRNTEVRPDCWHSEEAAANISGEQGTWEEHRIATIPQLSLVEDVHSDTTHGHTGGHLQQHVQSSSVHVQPNAPTPTLPAISTSQEQVQHDRDYASFQHTHGTIQVSLPNAIAGALLSNAPAGAEPVAAEKDDRPWDATIQAKYDRFIEVERGYVNEGRWDQFPHGSRLFVGNLSSDKVTKRDIFHVFHPYGELAQVSIKQAYGFVQFLRSEDCLRALQKEQGTVIRDKRIHLEISKPQKTRQSQNQQRRRSRSPDKRGTARHASGRASGGRHHSRRSPSPRWRERLEDRGYRLSSPDYGQRNSGRSPPHDEDLPLPKRQPHEVPDVQMIVLNNLERNFISWVEKAFSARGIRIDVLLLSPRLNESAVIRRQIVEGVLGVVKLDHHNQSTSKIGLQIFDRRGPNNVQFEEYQGLEPAVCAELVLRAKGRSQTVAPSTYMYNSRPVVPQQSYAGYQAHGSQPLVPTLQNDAANLPSLMSSLDANRVQNFFSAMQSGVAVPPAGSNHPSSAYTGAVTPQQGGSQVNMQEILARLSTYGK